MTLPARAPNLLMIARPKPRKGLAIAKLRHHATQQSRLEAETSNLPS
jgi:hypothetical protein